MMFHCWPGCLTVMYNQDVVGKVYAEDIKKNNDHALFLKVLKNCQNAMGMNNCLAKYRIRKGSISSRQVYIVKYYIKVIHDFEKHTYVFSLICVFTHVFVKKFFKYRMEK